MRKLVKYTLKFSYAPSPTGEMAIKNAYKRIFEMAKSNILSHKDILNGDMNTVDNSFCKVQTESNGRFINNTGNINEIKTFAGDSLSNDKTGRDAGS